MDQEERNNDAKLDNHNTEVAAVESKAAPTSGLSRFRLPQDFGAKLPVKKLLTAIPVRKPSNQEWVRVHPSPENSLKALVLELKEERETYLVDPVLAADLGSELKVVELRLAINRMGTVFVWPVKLPGEDGRIDSWSESALAATTEAETQWVRVKANMNVGAYDVFVSPGELAEPSWPSLSFDAILDIAFKGRVIKDLEHPVIRRLRGLS